jgi:hypothetical protein
LFFYGGPCVMCPGFDIISVSGFLQNGREKP